MRGLIFNIKRFSIHDGPGIRVTFFMKGCPLSCRWCHNPEGLSGKEELFNNSRKLDSYEFESIEKAGEYYDVSEILQILDKEQVFIRESDGGVTFSGGEPFMQPGFLLGALKACKESGYHTGFYLKE